MKILKLALWEEQMKEQELSMYRLRNVIYLLLELSNVWGLKISSNLSCPRLICENLSRSVEHQKNKWWKHNNFSHSLQHQCRCSLLTTSPTCLPSLIFKWLVYPLTEFDCIFNFDDIFWFYFFKNGLSGLFCLATNILTATSL